MPLMPSTGPAKRAASAATTCAIDHKPCTDTATWKVQQKLLRSQTMTATAMPSSQAKGVLSSVGEERIARLYYGTLISRTLPFLKSRPSVPTLSLRK
jgi:hypothetical protein